MGDMGWTTYINDIEDAMYMTCLNTRTRERIFADPEVLMLDCEEMPCHEICPLRAAGRCRNCGTMLTRADYIKRDIHVVKDRLYDFYKCTFCGEVNIDPATD